MFKYADAHCDIPCGIYETDTMTTAAKTVARMMKGIENLGELDTKEKLHTFTRLVAVKEAHADRAKREVAVLWGDYFKPEHVEKFPQLHETCWKAMKAGSRAKQTLEMAAAEELEQAIAEVAKLFADSKA